MSHWRFVFLQILLVVLSIPEVSAVGDPASSVDDGHKDSAASTEDHHVESAASIDDDLEDSSDRTFEPRFCKLLDISQLEKLRLSPSVGTVYFYKQGLHDRLETFLNEYDKAAGFLNAYGLTLGLVDCSGSLTESLDHECEMAFDDKIYTFRNGQTIFVLELETMFDVNSIMSNILQLALLDEVTIIQTKKNRQHLEHESAGQTDIIYGYHNAIGTYEHRVFMEIAYAYQDKYKFVVTTEPASIVELQDAESVSESSVCMMWVLYCREGYSAATGCRSVNYRGEFNLLALATFFKQLSWPKVFYEADDFNKQHPCEENKEHACVYLLHSEATKEAAHRIVDSIQFDVYGMAGLIVQRIEDQGSAKPPSDPHLAIKKAGSSQGVYVDFTQTWELEHVEFFIYANLFPISDDSNEEDTTLQTEEEEYGPDPDKIDDMVLHVAYQKRRTISDIRNIPALTDKTFPATVTEEDLVVVLFYIPFDSQGMLFLGPYQEAGTELAALKGDDASAHPLAVVNCFDWTDVCEKENITTYPTIHFYREGGKREQYRHALDKDMLVRTVRLLQADQPLMLKTQKDLESFMGGHLPEGFHQVVDNYVILRPSKSQKEVKAFKTVAKTLETQMLFAIVSPDVQTDLVPKEGMLHMRLKDKHQPFEYLTENLDADSIQSFLLKGQFHLLPELTHLNFPALYARKQPFGILFYLPKSESGVSQQLTLVDVIKSNTVPDLIFCKMSADNPVAELVLLKYTSEIVLPSFAIVNHQKGQVFVMQNVEFTQDSILTWILDALDDKLPPTKILDKGEWKPVGHHYDFLAKMDEEKRMKKKKKDGQGFYCDSPDCEIERARRVDASEVIGQNYEIEGQDSDIRSNLLELQRSRLYSGKDRKLTLPNSEEARPSPESSSQTTMAQMTADTSAVAEDEKKNGKNILHTEL